MGRCRGPSTSDQSLRCARREGQHILRQYPEKQETAVGEPTPQQVEDSSPPEHFSVTPTGPPNPSNLDVEEGEVESGDADIPDSVARDSWRHFRKSGREINSQPPWLHWLGSELPNFISA